MAKKKSVEVSTREEEACRPEKSEAEGLFTQIEFNKPNFSQNFGMPVSDAEFLMNANGLEGVSNSQVAEVRKTSGANADNKKLWIDMKSKHDLHLMDQLISPLPKLTTKISVGSGRHQLLTRRHKSRRHGRNRKEFWV